MNPRGRYKKAFFIGTVCLCIAMMILTALFRTRPTIAEDALGYVLTSAQALIGRATGWVEDKVGFFTSLSDIQDENASLKETIYMYETEIARLRLIERESEILNELLKLAQKYPDYETVGAEIIAIDPGNWYANFTIDKGRKDGLDRNMTVIAPGGLVGRVMEAGINYAKVKTLIDDANAISAVNARTGDIGVVKGDMRLMTEGLCRMELIDIDAEIAVGDEIVTSNLGQIYPPGLKLGYVTDIDADAGGLTKYAVIKPEIDFKHLETVLVIKEVFIRELIEYEEEPDEDGEP